MRIITGKYRGRNIRAPRNLPVRPTTDFAKSALFNILTNRVDFENIKVLDLFAGTGNITYEFISRGTQDITCVDSHAACIKFIHDTLNLLGAFQAKVVRSDVFRFLDYCGETFDVVFADPPFDMEKTETLPEIIFRKNLLNPGGWFILEHAVRTTCNTHPRYVETRKYGSLAFSLFQ